ncbi:MAG: hypothetical protein ABIE23_04970 [archaeon]|nr:hypothetical protein [Candidatus Micrarchaeota archaeon]
MGGKSSWKKFRDQKAGEMQKAYMNRLVTNREVTEKIVYQKQTPIDVLMSHIRKGLEPSILVTHISTIAERGNKSHIKYLEVLLRQYPERNKSPYPGYETVRSALLKGIKKLKEKKN